MCIICKVCPPAPGEAFCEVCIKAWMREKLLGPDLFTDQDGPSIDGIGLTRPPKKARPKVARRRLKHFAL